VFWSVAELPIAINRVIEDHNNDLKLFVWTANPDHETDSG
jgi:hypothetical protein